MQKDTQVEQTLIDRQRKFANEMSEIVDWIQCTIASPLDSIKGREFLDLLLNC
jgi:hypothetical protein